MLKICILARGLTQGGVKRFLENVLREIDINMPKDVTVSLVHNEPHFIGQYDNIKEKFIDSKNKLVFDYFASFPYIRKYEFDVIIYPKNVIPIIHYLTKGKKVNIVHDLGYFETKLRAYPLLDTLFMKAFIAISCRLSDKVLAVSDFTKYDIEKRLKIKPDKVKSIYEGVEENFKVLDDNSKISATLEKYSIKKEFIFYSGSISPRKNLSRVLEAYHKIYNYLPHDLVITGNKIWGVNEFDNYVSYSIQDRVKVLGYVSENELVDLYNAADLYIYPSLYEGFGLPILEAQKCGCPVLTSNVTSCPEVAGEGALIVNPYSVDEIAEGILKIINDRELRDELIKKGFENTKRYLWGKTVHDIIRNCKHIKLIV